MPERLPDSGEIPFYDILGARNGAGGFLRVAHNDDGTLKSSAITSSLAYTPVNKAGDTVTGPLTVSGSSVAAPRVTTTQTIGNGTGMTSGNTFYPEDLVTTITATDGTATTGYSLGKRSRFIFGSGGAATKGTCQSYTAEAIVTGCGDDNSEFCAYYGWMPSQIGTGFTQTTGPAGRYWFTDFKLNGPIAVQPNLLNGITMLINNYYNGSPSSSSSAGQWIVTKPGIADATHNLSNTYPVDVGLAIAGISSGSAAGFTTGLQLGGNGSGWGVTSRLTNAISIQDYDTYGIKITGKYSGSTPTASLAIASGVGQVILNGLTTPVSASALTVLHTSSGLEDPLIRVGNNTVAGAFTINIGNSSGLGKIAIGNAANPALVGAAAGDMSIFSSNKALHLGQGTARKISIDSTGVGFFGHATAAQPAAYTPTNVTTDRSYDANATTIDELADVLGTLVADLQSMGLVG